MRFSSSRGMPTPLIAHPQHHVLLVRLDAHRHVDFAPRILHGVVDQVGNGGAQLLHVAANACAIAVPSPRLVVQRLGCK